MNHWGWVQYFGFFFNERDQEKEAIKIRRRRSKRMKRGQGENGRKGGRKRQM